VGTTQRIKNTKNTKKPGNKFHTHQQLQIPTLQQLLKEFAEKKKGKVEKNKLVKRLAPGLFRIA
jgi:hypothetical protein